MLMIFKNRHDAGKKLANALLKYKNSEQAIILAIPRGGVEIGYEIAKGLKIKLDIIVTKKIGLPGDEEYAIGSVAPDKSYILNEDVAKVYNIDSRDLKQTIKEIGKEIERRYRAYKGSYKLQALRDKIVILVDDGIATGFTTKAAINYIKKQKPKKIILAVPVAPADTCNEMKQLVDEVVCLHTTKHFFAISQFYDEFGQLDDREVRRYLG